MANEFKSCREEDPGREEDPMSPCTLHFSARRADVTGIACLAQEAAHGHAPWMFTDSSEWNRKVQGDTLMARWPSTSERNSALPRALPPAPEAFTAFSGSFPLAESSRKSFSVLSPGPA